MSLPAMLFALVSVATVHTERCTKWRSSRSSVPVEWCPVNCYAPGTLNLAPACDPASTPAHQVCHCEDAAPAPVPPTVHKEHCTKWRSSRSSVPVEWCPVNCYAPGTLNLAPACDPASTSAHQVCHCEDMGGASTPTVHDERCMQWRSSRSSVPVEWCPVNCYAPGTLNLAPACDPASTPAHQVCHCEDAAPAPVPPTVHKEHCTKWRSSRSSVPVEWCPVNCYAPGTLNLAPACDPASTPAHQVCHCEDMGGASTPTVHDERCMQWRSSRSSVPVEWCPVNCYAPGTLNLAPACDPASTPAHQVCHCEDMAAAPIAPTVDKERCTKWRSSRSSVPVEWCPVNCYAPGTLNLAPACDPASTPAHQVCHCEDMGEPMVPKSDDCTAATTVTMTTPGGTQALAGVPVTERMAGWAYGGRNTKLHSFPNMLREASAHIPANQPLPEDTEFTATCNGCDGDACEVFVTIHNCPACSAGSNGNLPAQFALGGWEARSCAPQFAVDQLGGDYKMLTFRKMLLPGQEVTTPASVGRVKHLALFTLLSKDCGSLNEVSCGDTSSCKWKNDQCISAWCPKASGPFAPPTGTGGATCKCPPTH